LYEACASHGGLLVKFGQYLSNNAGTMVPAEYIEALKPLQDSCSPLPIEVIHECVEEELRKLCISRSEKGSSLIEQVFQEINPVPLGSASLAQVHAATLKDGRRVAIKVQRKHLATTTTADMIALHVLSRAIDRAFPGSGFEWML
jgi:predicted unusual protein kinase regulating ubiquinone biosynthesis (AarF/ABC1/UbiB family)